MTVTSLGITVDRHDSVTFWATRSEEQACLVIETQGAYYEIRLDRAQVETLRDQLPAVVDGLKRWATEDSGCARAEGAEERAVDAAARTLDLAAVAETAGAHDLAASLRSAAAEASVKADAVNAAVRGFEDATAEADHATETLINLAGNADTELRGCGAAVVGRKP